MGKREIIDSPSPVRDGEALDMDAVGAFLRQNIDGVSGAIEIRQFPSGFSNLTYFISADGRQMVLRRPPFGKKAKTAHDMAREYRILSALYPVFPYCPRPLAFCDDESVMGCRFYVMERIPGIILRKDIPKEIEFTPESASGLCHAMTDLLVKLHTLDYNAIGLSDFGKPDGYVRRQVEGWSRRYRDARTPDVPDFEPVMEWLSANMPADDPRPGIIHNDYKFDNLVLNPDNPIEIIGVLDWEMTTLGDPLMDLGNSLAYWIEAGDSEEMQAIRLMPTNVPGMMTRQELIDLYAEKTRRNIDDFAFYYCFGLFRLAVIAQQIYYRYFHGQTRDGRFARLGFAVAILENTAKQVIATGKI